MIAAGLQSTHSPRPSGAALPQSQSQTDHQDLGSRKSSARSKMSSSSDVIIACTRSETDMRRLKLCAFIMLEAPKTKKYNHNFANSHFLFWQKKNVIVKNNINMIINTYYFIVWLFHVQFDHVSNTGRKSDTNAKSCIYVTNNSLLLANVSRKSHAKMRVRGIKLNDNTVYFVLYDFINILSGVEFETTNTRKIFLRLQHEIEDSNKMFTLQFCGTASTSPTVINIQYERCRGPMRHTVAIRDVETGL